MRAKQSHTKLEIASADLHRLAMTWHGQSDLIHSDLVTFFPQILLIMCL